MPIYAVALIALALAPFAIYFALKRPLIFPFGLYVMMVPIDGVLGTTTTLTRFVAIVTGAALLFHMVISRRVLAPPKSWIAWGMYMLLACLTALWTINPDQTIFILTMLLQLFAFFTVIAIFPAERNDVRIVGAIVVASGVFVSAWGLMGYIQGIRTQGDRLTVVLNGLILDPNHIAAALLLPIALAVGTLLSTRDMRLRLGSSIALIVMLVTCFLTGSRGGLIALIVMLLYIAWKTRYRLQILAMIALGGVGSLSLPTVWDRFADKGLGGGSGRLVIWDAAKLAFKDHWLIGAGIGAFPSAYNHELFAMYQPVFQGWSRPAHNAFLSAAVEVGIVGGALHLYAWWRSWSDSKGNVVLEAAIVGLATASFFLDVLVIKYIWLAFSMAVLARNVAEPKYLVGKPRVAQRSAVSIFARRLPRPGRRTVVAPEVKRETAVGNL